MTDKEKEILAALKAGEYTVEKELESGGYYLLLDEDYEPGYHPVYMSFYVDDCTGGGTEYKITVRVKGETYSSYEDFSGTFDWDCSYVKKVKRGEGWDEYWVRDGEIAEEIVDWLDKNIEHIAADADEQLALQMKSVDDAMDMLEDAECDCEHGLDEYEYYEIDGKLYFFLPLDDEEDELDEAMVELGNRAKKLTKDEAAELVFAGAYEWWN